MLEEFLGQSDVAPLFAKGWQDVMIDVDRDAGGKLINEKLKGARSGGLPWMVILDGEGKEQVSSNDKNGANIGAPVQPDEVEHFVQMLQQTRGPASAEDVKRIAELLEAYASKKRRR